jgi:hypothetical protein
MAIPLMAAVSMSARPALLRMVDARVPTELVSSLVPLSEYVCPLVIVGASLIPVTTICAVALLREKAVEPPELAVEA